MRKQTLKEVIERIIWILSDNAAQGCNNIGWGYMGVVILKATANFFKFKSGTIYPWYAYKQTRMSRLLLSYTSSHV